MDNDTSEAHFLSRLGIDVEWVIVPVQTVQSSRLIVCRLLVYSIWLLALWWREVLALWSLRSTPVALSNEERRSDDTRVDLASLRIHDIVLCFKDGARLSLVVDANHLAPRFKLPALAADGKWLVEDHLALAIEDALIVELGDTRDLRTAGILGGVEVDYVLRGVLKGEDNWVGREDGEVGVEFLGKSSACWIRAIGFNYCDTVHRGNAAHQQSRQC